MLAYEISIKSGMFYDTFWIHTHGFMKYTKFIEEDFMLQKL